MLSLIALAALAAPWTSPARALIVAPPEATAGTHLRDVWGRARQTYRDAQLISISGATPADGKARCTPDAPFQNGWRFTFYSAQADQFVMMAECEGRMAGPLQQMRSRASAAARLTVSGHFVDSDEALRALTRAGVDLGALEAQLPGKRPFTLELTRLDDDQFPTHPTVWRVTAGNESYIVDAVNDQRFDPTLYGLDYSVQLASAIAHSAVLADRPKKEDVYTAKTDLEKVRAYAHRHFPDAPLMAIEGFVDAWGGSPCTGPGDGWAFYYYRPQTGGFDAVYSCNGYVGPGPVANIPVNVAQHEAITSPYIDSDKLLESLLVTHGDAFNETMGRRFTRTGTLVLRQYRAPPFADPALAKVRALWELTVGHTVYRFDAVNGRLLDTR
ncbi:MAG: hypothetical protein KGL53_05680 [Elusimicrobia bacterium]|nr:hypothetical protein [Elusimicrobiota bacterium]